VKYVAKKDGKYSTASSMRQALDSLDVGTSVDCYDDEGSLMSSCGVVQVDTPELAPPKPKKTLVVSDSFSWYGPVGLFGAIRSEAYLLEVNLQIDSHEYEEHSLLFFKSLWERVMFTATGPEDRFKEFKRRVVAISEEYQSKRKG